MKYLSVCSGIEAATQAWHPLGWRPAAFSEIEAFPTAVLRHHYPTVPNWGDMTKFQGWPDADVDVLVGGTPCQSFSVAGLRKGLADPRGNLALTYLAIADRYRPRWIVWENVPGVLSSSGGRDFGSFLGGLGQLGYGFAYRVLDAQHCRTRRFPRAVPQRRRRVFVIGYLGDWRPAAAVLFDGESLRGNPAPRREAGEKVAATVGTRAARGSDDLLNPSGIILSHDPACTLTAPERKGALPEADLSTAVAHALRGEGFDASEDGTGRGTPLVACIDSQLGFEVEACTTLRRDPGGLGYSVNSPPWAVRRLTPVECERLQAFPDNFTRIPYRNNPADLCPDGPRYKALGNSMSVNVMDWIGQRIAHVEALKAEAAA